MSKIKALKHMMMPLILVLVVNVTNSYAQPNNSLDARLTVDDSLKVMVDSLMAEYDNKHSPGAIVGIIQDENVIYSKGYGMANLAYGIPITSNTRFNLGSVSKQFLGFAMALLENRGRLSLDDPVKNYLSDWPEFEKKVTLMHLLTHTSGYRETYGTLLLAGRVVEEDHLPREEALEVVRRQPKLEFTPGSKFKYNSMAYVILAEVLEQVTGTPASKWVEDNIFDPLEMKNSVIESRVGEVIPNAADSYSDADSSGYNRLTSNRAIFGAAEVFTTVGDLAKWLQNFHTAELGGPEVQNRFREPFVFTYGDTSNYALGLNITNERGLKLIWHGGGHAGYRTGLMYYPQLNAGIVIMTNYRNLDIAKIVNNVSETVLAEYMEPEEKDTITVPKAKRVKVDSALLARHTGKYKEKSGENHIVEIENGRLLVDDYLAIGLSDTTFKLKNTCTTVNFHLGDNGKVNHATVRDSDSEYMINRIKPWNPSVKELQKFTGTYYSPEVETRYRITVLDSQLVAEHRWLGEFPLKSVEEDTFEGKYDMKLRFEQDESGTVTGYNASIFRTSGVWFEKKR